VTALGDAIYELAYAGRIQLSALPMLMKSFITSGENTHKTVKPD